MTWHSDQTEGRPEGEERDKLLYKRQNVEAQINALKQSPCGKSQTAINGRQEDLLALAKKIVSIDKKLGRNV